MYKRQVYGPWGTWFGGREKAPAAICRKVVEAKLNGTNKIEIWGSGDQTRSFMYIDDCVKGIQLITDSQILEPINLGSSEAVTINQLVDIVEDIAGMKLKRNYDLSAPKGVNGRNSDNTLIQKYLKWEPCLLYTSSSGRDNGDPAESGSLPRSGSVRDGRAPGESRKPHHSHCAGSARGFRES